MLVVSDVDDVFLPKPTDLLLNLSEARAGIESLLGRLNDMFVDNHTVGSALGPAMQAGFKLMVGYYLLWYSYVLDKISFSRPLVEKLWCFLRAYRALVLVRSRTARIRRY